MDIYVFEHLGHLMCTYYIFKAILERVVPVLSPVLGLGKASNCLSQVHDSYVFALP